MFQSVVHKSKIIRFDLPQNMSRGQKLFFNSDQELLNSTLLGLRGLPIPLPLDLPDGGQPYADYGDNTTRTNMRLFFISLSDNFTENAADTFAYYNMPIQAFAGLSRLSYGLILPLKQRINWGKSFIQASTAINFENPESIYLEVFFKPL